MSGCVWVLLIIDIGLCGAFGGIMLVFSFGYSCGSLGLMLAYGCLFRFDVYLVCVGWFGLLLLFECWDFELRLVICLFIVVLDLVFGVLGV